MGKGLFSLAAIVTLASPLACSNVWRGCKNAKGGNGYECSMITEQYHLYRYTETGGNCIIDIEKGYNYEVWFDKLCDGSVDEVHYNGDIGERGEFGSKYDIKFRETKKLIGTKEQNAHIKLIQR